jgi:hypothetical protein
VHEDFPSVINNVSRLRYRSGDNEASTRVVVIRWLKFLDIIFIMFEVFYTSCELL